MASINQVVVFKIDTEFYGIEILKVQEILNYMAPSPIPNVPEYLKGIINLRGTIIPVVDLRTRFHFPNNLESIESSVIVVVNIDDRRYGLIVDSVSDVITIDKENIQDDVDIHTGIDNRFVTGLAKLNEQMIILIDIGKIFKKEELESMVAHASRIK